MMRAALSPNFPLPQWPRRARAAARPKDTTFLNYINYVLGYYNYSLIISSYHNDARSPSPQFPATTMTQARAREEIINE